MRSIKEKPLSERVNLLEVEYYRQALEKMSLIIGIDGKLYQTQ
jgi:hypothetical protein